MYVCNVYLFIYLCVRFTLPIQETETVVQVLQYLNATIQGINNKYTDLFMIEL